MQLRPSRLRETLLAALLASATVASASAAPAPGSLQTLFDSERPADTGAYMGEARRQDLIDVRYMQCKTGDSAACDAAGSAYLAASERAPGPVSRADAFERAVVSVGASCRHSPRRSAYSPERRRRPAALQAQPWPGARQEGCERPGRVR